MAKGGKKVAGRQKGTPNKATAEARAAIAAFVDGNAHRLQGWLDKIADGEPADEVKGFKAIQPDPEKAFQLFQSVIEYHVPKLARAEITGKDGAALETPSVFNIVAVAAKPK